MHLCHMDDKLENENSQISNTVQTFSDGTSQNLCGRFEVKEFSNSCKNDATTKNLHTQVRWSVCRVPQKYQN